MSISTESASVYTDLNGLQQLKHKLKGDSVDDLRVVAKQFEAIFIQQMLKTMRDASLSEGLFDNNASDFYVDMLDKQMSLNLSEGRGIGLADIIVQQMSDRMNLEPEKAAEHTAGENPQLETAPLVLPVSQRPTNAEYALEKDRVAENPQNRIPEIKQNRSELLSNKLLGNEFLSGENSETMTDPQTFIKSLWPMAVNAAKEIGVPPQVLIAQAALETGWGQFIAKGKDGQSSHNLFNIKAGSDWQGDTVTLATTELKNGTAVKEYAAFRAYDSYNSSFEDYVALVKHNPRYRQALSNSTNARDYTDALQKAGYATDPEYSEKVSQIANGQTMLHVSEGLGEKPSISQSNI